MPRPRGVSPPEGDLRNRSELAAPLRVASVARKVGKSGLSPQSQATRDEICLKFAFRYSICGDEHSPKSDGLPGCHNVQEIAINRVTDEQSNFNWSLCVLSSGTADANTAARAAVYVQSVLRRDYELLTD